jgi:selT/selW/selH-like putative selenoprotein
MIEHAEYPPKPLNALLAKLLSYAQYAIMGLSFFGDWLFRQIGITPPALYNQLKEKKFVVIMVVMFLGNNIHNMLLSSGAFEVYLDNQLIFSKLATGRMPAPQELEAFF